MEVSAVVATFGDPIWADRARVAMASLEAQTLPPFEIIHVHGVSLQAARNEGAARAAGEWLCFLDADDMLDPHYLEAMAAHELEADLLGPHVQYVFEGGKNLLRPAMPKVPGHTHDCGHQCLTDGNYLVVGTLVRKAMFVAVGGFWDEEFYEDWSLWLRCVVRAGATAVTVPEAVYIATHRYRSRNKAHTKAEKEAMHWRIHGSILGAPA